MKKKVSVLMMLIVVLVLEKTEIPIKGNPVVIVQKEKTRTNPLKKRPNIMIVGVRMTTGQIQHHHILCQYLYLNLFYF